MKSVKNPTRLFISIGLAASVLIVSVLLIPYPKKAQSDNLPEEIRELLVKNPAPVRPFELLDQDKKPFNVDRLKGSWTLMFFGYTHCPDVCPTTLTELDNAASRLNKINPETNKLQYVFVSIDPERDTPELLGDYVSYFGAKFIAVTGEHEQLKNLANPLGIKYSIGIGFNKEYIVNHGSAMLLIDPEGRYYARFKAPHYAEEIVAGFKSLKKYYGENR
ncbi:SCO family protein [Kaarinaea lacus]